MRTCDDRVSKSIKYHEVNYETLTPSDTGDDGKQYKYKLQSYRVQSQQERRERKERGGGGREKDCVLCCAGEL